MTNAERQARFRRKQQAELERLKAQNVGTDDNWRKGKTPEEIAALDDLARQYHEADKRCADAIDLKARGAHDLREAASELLKLCEALSAHYSKLLANYNALVVDYNELLDDYEAEMQGSNREQGCD